MVKDNDLWAVKGLTNLLKAGSSPAPPAKLTRAWLVIKDRLIRASTLAAGQPASERLSGSGVMADNYYRNRPPKAEGLLRK